MLVNAVQKKSLWAITVRVQFVELFDFIVDRFQLQLLLST